MKTCFAILVLLFLWQCTHGQIECGRKLIYPYPRLKSRLDSAICIPNGYCITDIYDNADLNLDGQDDKVVRFQKVKLQNGDTIYYSIYTKTVNSSFVFYKTLGNLEPIYFDSYQFEDKTGNKLYDSIKTKYSYPTLSEVKFEANSINLVFYSDASTIKKLWFNYDPKEKNWVLKRETQWFAPPKNYSGDEKLDEHGRKLEFDHAVIAKMKIEDFNMIKYIGW
jgi:hypothetical protein